MLLVDILTDVIVYECVVYLTTTVLKRNFTHGNSSDLLAERIVYPGFFMLSSRQILALDLI